jgi:hypothetical protein
VPSARSRGDSSCRLGSGIFRVIVRRRAGLNLVTRGGHLGHCPLPRTTRSMYSCQSGCLPRGHRHQARTCSFASTWGAPAIRLRPPGGCDLTYLRQRSVASYWPERTACAVACCELSRHYPRAVRRHVRAVPARGVKCARVALDRIRVTQARQRRGTLLLIAPGDAHRQRRPDIDQTAAHLFLELGAVEFLDIAPHRESPVPSAAGRRRLRQRSPRGPPACLAFRWPFGHSIDHRHTPCVPIHAVRAAI